MRKTRPKAIDRGATAEPQRVVDIHQALNTAFLFLLVPAAVSAAIYFWAYRDIPLAQIWRTLALYSVPFMYFPFKAYFATTAGIKFDPRTDTIEIPGSNTDMSLLDILTFKTTRQKLGRERLRVSDIQGVTNHRVIKRWQRSSWTTWILIVSGRFGSRALQFSSKQKRDEARVMFRQVTRGIFQDMAFDQTEYR